ncbi:MAG: hypothetical protein RL885_21925 [Planctomycetota bacterium]
MKPVRWTLLTDGSSDRVLLHPVRWLLTQISERPFEGTWADLSYYNAHSQVGDRASASLSRRICESLHAFPCERLIVHRDAEGQPAGDRRREIESAVAATELTTPAVRLVPVRMTEAWLLISECAIRHAAGNPSPRTPLPLPRISKLEKLPDPKSKPKELLRKASEFEGRRLKKFKSREAQAVHRTAELIQDFSPLRSLSAFRQLELDLTAALDTNGWR